jgi:fatty-acyl-CoA synthase
MAEPDLSRLMVGAILDRQADRFGDRDFVAFADRDFRLTYREFRDRVDLVARGLMGMGVRKSEHVAIWAPNIPEWLLLQYATGRIGATLVPINTGLRARELEFVLRHSETTTLVFGGASGDAESVQFLQTVREMLPDVDSSPVGHGHFEKLPRFSRLLSIGKQRLPGMLRFDDLFDLSAQTHPDDLRRRTEALDSFDVIMLQYTSGTTGFPKGVMLTHRNVIVTAWNMTSGMGASENDRLCEPLPFYHCFASIGGSIGCAMRGACIVPVERFDPRSTLEAIDKQRCTAIQATPSMLSAMLAEPDLESFDRSTLRRGTTGGEPVPIELARAAVERLGITEMTVGYGLAEASVGVTRSSPDDPIEKRLGTVGRALPTTQVKVVGPGSGDALPPGTQGELCCRGLGLMKGYYKDPEGTAEAIDVEGWLHTKDLATIDEEGYVNIVGRMRDMIIHAGEKIYPRETEVFLYSHPKIADVQVIGVPNRSVGEDVCAVVKLKPGEELTEAEVLEYCRGRLQDSKIPTLLMTVREFPLTAGGKVIKRVLREMAIEKFGRQQDAAVKTA